MVTKVTNLETVKLMFRHLLLLLSFFLSSTRLAPEENSIEENDFLIEK